MFNARTPMPQEGSSLNVQTEKVKQGLSAEFRNHANAPVLCFEPLPLGFLDLVILWSLRFGPSVLPIVPLGCKLTLQPGYLPQAFRLLRDFARQSCFSIA